MNYHVEKATTHNVDVTRLLEIFGVTNRQVCSFKLSFETCQFIRLDLSCKVSKEEMAALLEEFEKNPPVQKAFIGLSHSPTTKDDND